MPLDLHDVEFVAEQPELLKQANRPKDALKTDDDNVQKWELVPSNAGVPLGDGDRKIIDAFGVLVKLKEEGLILDIGISGTYCQAMV